ncbi:hypothetical protein EDB85DRAFT_1892583 [Lactarius pseudohatsudake]|nr:hypothetical protein EDB85DRAFT_1892578 [Lactarius pseudohatsudake]KAH9028289.1 hypothetical protein EDB85DRAFT_1892583 [Lactarius pseudohatsudake]
MATRLVTVRSMRCRLCLGCDTLKNPFERLVTQQQSRGMVCDTVNVQQTSSNKRQGICTCRDGDLLLPTKQRVQKYPSIFDSQKSTWPHTLVSGLPFGFFLFPPSRSYRSLSTVPNGAKWEELDVGDADNAMMSTSSLRSFMQTCAKWEDLGVHEVGYHMMQTTLPNLNYMDSRKDLIEDVWYPYRLIAYTTGIRDQAIQVDMRSRILPQTPYLSVNNVNRFLSARVVSLAGLQIWVHVCRIMAPPVGDFLKADMSLCLLPSSTTFSLHMSCFLLSYSWLALEAAVFQLHPQTLEWNMSYPNFLHRVSEADECDVQPFSVVGSLRAGGRGLDTELGTLVVVRREFTDPSGRYLATS